MNNIFYKKTKKSDFGTMPNLTFFISKSTKKKKKQTILSAKH